MRLFIANVSRQRQVVYYRLDFIVAGNAAERTGSLKQMPINPGQQVTIGGDLDLKQAQIIMDQLAPYGGIGIEEINRLPNHKLVYIMSLDKEVPARVIKLISEHNDQLLTYQGDTRRRQAAMAAHPIVDNQIDNLKRLDIEMLQVPPEAGEAEPVGKALDFGVRLDPNARRVGEAPRPAPARRGRARK